MCILAVFTRRLEHRIDASNRQVLEYDTMIDACIRRQSQPDVERRDLCAEIKIIIG